jgi:hypothetical protein
MKNRRKLIAIITVLMMGAFAVSTVTAAPFQQGKASQKADVLQSEWVEEIFIDYTDDTHAGPGPHPTTESDRFRLIQGGIRWFSDSAVKYKISGTEDVTGGNTAIESAVSTIDGFVTTREFTRDDSSPSSNPCGGVNEVVWTSIDGPGEVLATASVCRNVATKEIGGFVVTIDTDETWSTSGESSKFDVENVVAHEFGHVAGLGHVNAPQDGCLTMYRFAGTGETQKRTLGWGDKLGMDELYSTGDTTPGPGCGL